MVALGFILARVLQSQIVSRTLADASQSAQLIAHIAVQPRLTPRDLRTGLSAEDIQALDEQLSARSVTQDLARIKIWNRRYKVIYSDDHRLIGRTFCAERRSAGRAQQAGPTPRRSSRRAHTARRRARSVSDSSSRSMYRCDSRPPVRPEGAFEIYLSYSPIAAAISRDKTMIVLFVSIGLALLWAVLYRIVARASRRLRRQSEENYSLARHDQLTGLPNRTLFIERVWPKRCARTARVGARRGAADRPGRLQADQQHARHARSATTCCARSVGACASKLGARRSWRVSAPTSMRSYAL